MPIVKPPTACTLECPICLCDQLHKRAWGSADWVCQKCGTTSDKRPPVRLSKTARAMLDEGIAAVKAGAVEPLALDPEPEEPVPVDPVAFVRDLVEYQASKNSDYAMVPLDILRALLP